MRPWWIAAISCLCCFAGKAQQIVDVDAQGLTGNHDRTVESAVTGEILQPYKYVRITDGTPYFNKDYMKARMTDATGSSYASNAVRLNLLDNEIDYRDAAGNELVATTPIKRIELTDSTTGTRYLFVKGDQIPEAGPDESKGWLQILVNDKVSLCKKIKKSIRETIPYGTSTTEEQIASLTSYYVRMNNSLTRVKDWQDLLRLFADRKDAVAGYVKAHHLKGRSDAEYSELVRFYNS